MRTKYLLTLSLSVIALLNTELNADSSEQSEQDTTVNISMPKVPEVEAIVVPAVNVVVDGKQNNIQETQESDINRKIGFSKRVPPEDIEVFDPTDKNTLVGEVKNSRVAAYLRSSILSEQEVTTKLKDAGFTVLASYKLDKKGTLTSIVFTDKEMVSSASKEMRGFAGTLRLLIDKESSLISISNPIYIMKAFMQDQYNQKVATQTLERLRKAFNELEDSKDVLKVTRLENYQFMMSMPYYEAMQEVALGSNKVLLQKARKSNKIVYEQHLDNGSIVLGIDLSKRTKKFVKKIGHQNAGLLPYPVLIENGKAKTLAPKYYIAVMYPMLSMSQFMGIATIPGAIEKECYKVFR
jgi:hypothetical protein